MSGEPTRLLDSVILIDHFNGREEATAYLKKVFQRASVSVITRAEVLTGFEMSHERENARLLLDRLHLYNIDRPTADLAADLRRSENWGLPDAFQAAIARFHGMDLVTRNTRDFDVECYDFVEVPYQET